MSLSVKYPAPVLLFDGECGLCRAVVGKLIRADRASRLRFAALQSAPAQTYLRARGLPTRDFDSLVFVPDWNTPEDAPPLFHTDGVLAAAEVVGGAMRLVTWMRVLPRWLRDPFYRLIARSRHALFGEYKPASPPDPAWVGRFL